MIENRCGKLGTKEQEQLFIETIKNAKKYKFTTIKVLQEIQKIYGYLAQNVLETAACELEIPVSELYSVASFYAEFSFSPKGRFPISVCLGTACYVKGAEDIFNKVCQILNIKEGETTSDMKFSIDQTRCIGCCGMAPVMTVGEDVFGNVKLSEVEKILAKYMEKE